MRRKTKNQLEQRPNLYFSHNNCTKRTKPNKKANRSQKLRIKITINIFPMPKNCSAVQVHFGHFYSIKKICLSIKKYVKMMNFVGFIYWESNHRQSTVAARHTNGPEIDMPISTFFPGVIDAVTRQCPALEDC